MSRASFLVVPSDLPCIDRLKSAATLTILDTFLYFDFLVPFFIPLVSELEVDGQHVADYALLHTI
jgi:hypothetical protein